MAHDVLISYSSHDKLQADAICNRLESEGVRCWIAPRDVPVGSEYADAIVKAIEAARVLVLLYSNSANESEQVKREVERAVSEGTQIMPIRLEDVPMSKSFEYYVGSIHWLDAITPPLEAHIDRLVQNLKHVLEQEAPETVPGDPGAAAHEVDVAGPGAEPPLSAPAGPDPAVAAEPSAQPAAPAAVSPPAAPAASPSGGPPPPSPSPGGRKWTRYAIAALAVPVIIAGWFFLSGPTQRLVPNVANMSLAAATQRLEEEGFGVSTELVESASPPGTVVGMDPAAGDEAAVGSQVQLQLAGTLPLPDLTGLTLAEAHERLRVLQVGERRFDPATVQVETLPSGPEGVVQRTDPGPGQLFLLGDPVTLFVAGETVSVPDIAGRSWTDAVSDLQGAELTARRTLDWEEGAATGAVLWTRPAADAEVQRGTEIEVGVAGTGGWVYMNRQDLEPDQVLRMRSGLNLRQRPVNDARQLGVAPAGAQVRVLEPPTPYGWVKIVIVDR